MFSELSFFIIGSVQLLFLAYSDLKKGMVDDRYNYLMMGIVLALYLNSGLPFWYFSIFMIFNLVMSISLAMSKVGRGDISAFNWITLGFAIANPYLIIYFWSGILLLMVVQRKIIKESMPYFPFILTLFLLCIGVNYTFF